MLPCINDIQMRLISVLWAYRKTRTFPVWITFGAGLALSVLLSVIALTESLARNKQWSAMVGPDVYPGPVIDTLITLTQRTTIPVYGLSVIIAVSAAVLTVHRIQSEDYILLILTNVSNWKLVLAHVLRILHRWRLPLIFLIGTAPLYITIGLLPDNYWCGESRRGFAGQQVPQR